MNPRETRDLDDLIVRLRDEEDLTIFLIEHDMSLVMSLSERIYVMDYGKLIAEGTPEEIKNNHDVITAYLEENEALLPRHVVREVTNKLTTGRKSGSRKR